MMTFSDFARMYSVRMEMAKMKYTWRHSEAQDMDEGGAVYIWL
jgi:hypothetical protein